MEKEKEWTPLSADKDFEYRDLGYLYEERHRRTKVITHHAERVKGRVHGLVQDFYPNGKKKAETEFNMGVMDGWHRVWDQRGKFVVEVQYKNNTYHGIARKYWPSTGTLHTEGMFNHGRQDGIWKEYNHEGRLMAVTQFKDGVEITQKAKKSRYKRPNRKPTKAPKLS